MAATDQGLGAPRIIALAVVVAVGIAGLPVVAAFLDGAETENLVASVHLAVATLLGAVIGSMVPAVAGRGASQARGAGVGAVVGLGAGLLGLLIFVVLLG